MQSRVHKRDPTTDRHGGFDLLRLRPGPVHPSLDDLVVPSSPRSTISIPNLVRTPDRHSPLQPRTPELKRSASLSLPVAWITGARHCTRRELRVSALLLNLVLSSALAYNMTNSKNSFDPVKIAYKLRELGDDYDERVIRPLMKNVQSAGANQVVTVFSDSVDSLCKMWVVERAEVDSEKHLLKAAITLGLFIKKNSPDMTNVVEVAMTGFVNNRLTNWIANQGGWVSVSKKNMC
ncbi:bcl-2 15 [Labeo rohita]|uniref:Bcl-2 15 n=1 Tax=Labeo rohita TaxID=84645 RepID=A0A498LAY0_LABRO|nr:bcl-2 15 [Labeo rohita]